MLHYISLVEDRQAWRGIAGTRWETLWGAGNCHCNTVEPSLQDRWYMILNGTLQLPTSLAVANDVEALQLNNLIYERPMFSKPRRQLKKPFPVFGIG